MESGSQAGRARTRWRVSRDLIQVVTRYHRRMSPAAIPYVATVTASAEEARNPAWGALVHDDKVRWCTPDGIGATLTVTFDRPVAIGEVWLTTGSDRDTYTDPEEIQLVTDTKSVAARIVNGSSNATVKLD